MDSKLLFVVAQNMRNTTGAAFGPIGSLKNWSSYDVFMILIVFNSFNL